MTTQDITFTSAGTNLAGTLTLPSGDGPFPAALIIAGSGPLDRDGNHEKLPLSVSKDLAGVLADNGWASLRFDKRGIGESGGDYLSTGFFEELDDAMAGLAYLQSLPETGRIVAIGHSVGALYAAEMSARESEDLAGAVLLAYTLKSGHDTLVWQAGAIGESIPGFVKGLLKVFRSSVEKQQAKAIKKLQSTTDDVQRIQGQKINAKWMREFIDYEPAPVLSMTATPLLAITGSKDVQVDPDDLADVERMLGDRVETHVVPDVDHILRYTDAPFSDPKKYKHQIAEPIDARVVSALTSWLGGLDGDGPGMAPD